MLRGDSGALNAYLRSFESAIAQAARNLESRLGPLDFRVSIGTSQGDARPALGWPQALRLVTVLGCAELAVRGSDKSRYGKLFERLVLGGVLSILDFALSALRSGRARRRVFWLSDATDERKCDATAIIEPGRVARFDIGFIGKGNPEIVRDKLSRFSREVERAGRMISSCAFVVIDRYPTGPHANTRELAEKSGATIIQMSMSLWPRELARALREKMGFMHPLADYDDAEAEAYITQAIERVDVLKFVTGMPESQLDDGASDATDTESS